MAREEENRPDHYGGPDNPYEVFKVLRAWGKDDFWYGNAIKYLARAGQKPGVSEVDDLIKARTYINQIIADREGQTPKARQRKPKPRPSEGAKE